MKMPPFIIGSAVLFWGWQTGLWFAAIPAAALLESSRLVSFRLDMSTREFHRVANLCSVIFAGVTIYYYVSNQGVGAIFSLMQWLPMIFLPIVAAQVYSSSDKVEAQIFFLFLKIDKDGEKRKGPKTIDLVNPFFAVCLIAASAANSRTIWFYVGAAALCVWALWTIRSPRFSPLSWSGLALLAVIMGYVGSVGLFKIYAIVDNVVVAWIFDRLQSDMDPFKARTAIGDIGKLKMSDKILYRIKYDIGHTKSILLPQASYNLYKSSNWFASAAPFISMAPEQDGSTWKIRKSGATEKLITVSAYLKRGKGLLLAPNQLFQVEKMPVEFLARNRLGTVRVEKGPDFVRYKIRLHPEVSLNSPPGERDLRIPRELDFTLGNIADEMGLSSKLPAEIPNAIMDFFEEKFAYTLKLEGVRTGKMPLEDFLTRTRKGHCEYFATATVLLLRKAGIPARYVFGYSAHEYGWQEQNLIVRSRNAHAWAAAFIDGKWINVDSTPSTWIKEEDEGASPLEPLFDLWSFMVLQFSKWRWSEEEQGLQKYIAPLLIPVLLILVWRIYRRTRVAQKSPAPKTSAAKQKWHGLDSDFYLIEKHMKGMGLERDPWETHAGWLKRISHENAEINLPPLFDIVSSHYRYRFDPIGLSEREEDAYNSKIRSWLESHSAANN